MKFLTIAVAVLLSVYNANLVAGVELPPKGTPPPSCGVRYTPNSDQRLRNLLERTVNMYHRIDNCLGVLAHQHNVHLHQRSVK